jgi:D-glycero-D-manno-heptose 1,7-bisphosphate phosphatase
MHACYHNDVTDSVDSPLTRKVRTVFLDRDGVLNQKMPEGQWVTRWADFHVLPGVPETIAKLNEAGLRVIVVSNQRGIALGRFSSTDVEAIHTAFQKLIKTHGAHVDAFFFCPHDRLECNCRKPLPGMFEQARGEFPEISATTSAMIGDSLPDVEFGRRLGMLTVFIDGAQEYQKPGAQKASTIANLCFNSLQDAVKALLNSR